MQSIFDTVYDNRMTGIVSAGKTAYHIVCLCHMVNNLAFSFVTPLESYNQIRL